MGIKPSQVASLGDAWPGAWRRHSARIARLVAAFAATCFLPPISVMAFGMGCIPIADECAGASGNLRQPVPLDERLQMAIPFFATSAMAMGIAIVAAWWLFARGLRDSTAALTSNSKVGKADLQRPAHFL